MKTALVITSISHSENPVLLAYARQSAQHDVDFIVMGDHKSPADFNLSGCSYYPLEKQKDLPYQLAKLLPAGHYSRKNLGYLQAMSQQAPLLIETDDDNFPLENFWQHREVRVTGRLASGKRWINAFQFFNADKIWPRGFALRDPEAGKPVLVQESGPLFSPVQQYLANGAPDIDAIQRLANDVQVEFRSGEPLLLASGSICPFNSQNTVWFPEAYALLYLPSTCSFRMCDIWRSFVVQRVLHACGWYLSFHSPTVYQERNPHNLLQDLEEETAGYLFNEKIVDALWNLELKPGAGNIPQNIKTCYGLLVSLGLLDLSELMLLDAWLNDVSSLSAVN